MLIIEPALFLIMSLETIWQMTNAAVRFTRRTSSQSVFFMRNESPSRVIPALFTSTSNPPDSARAAFTTSVTCSALPTSAYISWKAVPLSFARDSSSSFPALGFEQSPQTSHPFFMNVSAIPRPIPREDPVTRAFLFCSSMIYFSILLI